MSSFGWPPLPSPSSDDIIYEQPLMMVMMSERMVTMVVIMMMSEKMVVMTVVTKSMSERMVTMVVMVRSYLAFFWLWWCQRGWWLVMLRTMVRSYLAFFNPSASLSSPGRNMSWQVEVSVDVNNEHWDKVVHFVFEKNVVVNIWVMCLFAIWNKWPQTFQISDDHLNIFCLCCACLLFETNDLKLFKYLKMITSIYSARSP